MATKRKDEAAQQEPRKDASGRELFDWEVDPADQATSLSSEVEEGASTAGGSPEGTGAGGDQ